MFQIEGHLRLAFGPSGAASVEGVVHRERNPGTEPNEAMVFRVGEGELLVNVDGS